MKLTAKSLTLACALALTSVAAHAEIVKATLAVGGDPVFASRYTLSGLDGSGTLSFSKSLMGALNAAGAVTTALTPATMTIVSKANVITAPLSSLSGDFDSQTGTLTATKVKTLGGALITTEADDFTNTGGSLSLTNLSVDLATKSIFADLTGGNGVGPLKQVQIWNYANITGPTTFQATFGGIQSSNVITGLMITAPTFDLFAQSLGLTDAGKGAMQQITDYGRIDATIKVMAGFVHGSVIPPREVPIVPEPTTYAMMGLGLIGLIVVTQRKRRAD